MKKLKQEEDKIAKAAKDMAVSGGGGKQGNSSKASDAE